MNNSIINENENKLQILPENLHFILVGIMLGDGSISRFSPTSNSRFEMGASRPELNIKILLKV